MMEPIATTSSSISESTAAHRSQTSRHERKILQGGSLKMPKNKDKKDNNQSRLYDTMKINRKYHTTEPFPHNYNISNKKLNIANNQERKNLNDSLAQSSTSSIQCGLCYSESNPSNNVILEVSSSSKNSSSTVDQVKSDNSNNHDHSLSTECSTSTNINLESKRKLDRSKSLE